jgi:hypothetical protein
MVGGVMVGGHGNVLVVHHMGVFMSIVPVYSGWVSLWLSGMVCRGFWGPCDCVVCWLLGVCCCCGTQLPVDMQSWPDCVGCCTMLITVHVRRMQSSVVWLGC